MQYSFIKPRAKRLVSPEFKLLFFFFSITIGMLFMSYSFSCILLIAHSASSSRRIFEL